MTVRPGSRRAGIAAALVACAATAGLAAVHSVPAQAATGFFLYTDGATGAPTLKFAPDDEKCFDVFKATDARNYTDTAVILFADGLCSEVMLTLVPGETLNVTFNSYGFSPGGGAQPAPHRLPS